jgi:glycosyltransferase involved in cell wall biosynthesis
MRFCMITTFYPPWSFGGDAVGIERLNRGLLRRGHEVTVIHEADAFQSLHRGEEPAPPPPEPGLQVIGLRSRLRTVATLLTHQSGRPLVHGARIRRILADGRFDVINFHNISLVGGPGILGYGEAPKLYMAHEHWLVCESHVLWRHGRELCTGRECLRCVLSYRRPPQLWRYTGHLQRQLRHVDSFIAMSEFSRSKHREFGFPREMEVLPYFLPDPAPGEGEPQAKAPGQSPHSRPYFLFVGRLEKIKGLDEVIPLFAQFADADLLIAGTGEHEGELKRLAGGNPRVRFLGRLPMAQLERYYRHAVALLVPSVCFETFGIILIEAFRHGTPVIARRIGPFPEIVEKAQGGELFTTEADLVAAMQRFLRDPAWRRQCAQQGFRAYVAHWSESAVVPKYLEIVQAAAEHRRQRTQTTA